MLVPYKRETLVLPIPVSEVLFHLDRVTRPLSRSVKKGETQFLFNGSVDQARFAISRRVDYPNNYIPLVKGHGEDSTRGCILFLEYSLFFSSLMFLVFWSAISVLLGLFLFFYAKETTYAVIALLAGITNYTVTLMNFRKQYAITKKLLFDALELHG